MKHRNATVCNQPVLPALRRMLPQFKSSSSALLSAKFPVSIRSHPFDTATALQYLLDWDLDRECWWYNHYREEKLRTRISGFCFIFRMHSLAWIAASSNRRNTIESLLAWTSKARELWLESVYPGFLLPFGWLCMNKERSSVNLSTLTSDVSAHVQESCWPDRRNCFTSRVVVFWHDMEAAMKWCVSDVGFGVTRNFVLWLILFRSAHHFRARGLVIRWRPSDQIFTMSNMAHECYAWHRFAVDFSCHEHS